MGVVRFRDQVPLVHGATSPLLPEPGAETVTLATSPVAVPQAPPTDVTFVLVAYGKVTSEPFTFVRVTAGPTVSLLASFGPSVPVLPTASPWVTVTEIVPSVDRIGLRLRFQAPDVQAVGPDWVRSPVTATFTVAASPVAVPQAPPTEVRFAPV